MHGHTIDQRVEWLYAFDVHCNAYFPMFLALYVLQYFLSPVRAMAPPPQRGAFNLPRNPTAGRAIRASSSAAGFGIGTSPLIPTT